VGKLVALDNYLTKVKVIKRQKPNKSHKYGSVTFDIFVVCTYNNGKYGKYGIKYFAYAVYLSKSRTKSHLSRYGKRFGIELSLSVKNQCRIKTTTKNPVVRLLFYGIAFIDLIYGSI
jgi:putative transposase